MCETPAQFGDVERAPREAGAAEKALEGACKALDTATVDSHTRPVDYSRIAHITQRAAADRIGSAIDQLTKRGHDAMSVLRATSVVEKVRLARATKPALDPVLTAGAIEQQERASEEERVTSLYAELYSIDYAAAQA